MYAQVTIQIIIIGQIRPLRNKNDTTFEFFNEIVILLSTYSVMCFSSWIPDEDVKFRIGYALVLVVAGHLLVNFSLVLKQTFVAFRQKYCATCCRCKSKAPKTKKKVKSAKAGKNSVKQGKDSEKEVLPGQAEVQG